MHPSPVWLRMHALMLPTAREQPRIHGRLLHARHGIPVDALPIRGFYHRRDAGAGHALRGDLPPREPLSPKPEHQLRLDLAYHPNNSFCRVIGHTAEGA